MGLVCSTPATVDPISVAELKTHCRIDTDAEDDYISALISAATQDTQAVQWRQFVNATYTLTLSAFPSCGYIELPRPPLSSITSIKYLDTNGTQQTWDAANYRMDKSCEPGRICLAYNVSWPTIRSQSNAVEIIYVAGFGAAGSNVPEIHRHAIRFKAAHWYENREPVINGVSTAEVPMTAKRLDLIGQFRGLINVYESGLATP